MATTRRRTLPVGLVALGVFVLSIVLVAVTWAPDLRRTPASSDPADTTPDTPADDRGPRIVRAPETAPPPRRSRRERRPEDIDALRRDQAARTVALSGVVVDLDGRWARSPTFVRLEAQDGTGRALDAGPLGNDAAFRLTWRVPVERGVIRLRAAHADGRVSPWWSSEFWDPRDDIEHWVVLQLSPAVDIVGRTVDADGAPVGDMPVVVSSTSLLRTLREDPYAQPDRSRVRSAADGSFQVRARADNEVRLVALSQDGVPGPVCIVSTVEGKALNSPCNVRVPTGDPTRWQLRFVDPDDRPLEGVRVEQELATADAPVRAVVPLGPDGADVSNDEGAFACATRPDGETTYVVASRADLVPLLLRLAPGPAGAVERTVRMTYRPGARIRLVRDDGGPAPANVILRVQKPTVPPVLAGHDLRSETPFASATLPTSPAVANQFQYRASRSSGATAVEELTDVRVDGGQTARVVAYLHHEATGVRGRPLLVADVALQAVRAPGETVLRLPAGRRVALELPFRHAYGAVSPVDLAVWVPGTFDAPDGIEPPILEHTVLWRSRRGLPTDVPRQLELWIPLDVLELRCGFLEASDRAKTFDGGEAVAAYTTPHVIPIPVSGNVRARIPDALFDALDHVRIAVDFGDRPNDLAGVPITVRRVAAPLEQYVQGQVLARLDAYGVASVLLPPGTFEASIAGGSAGKGSTRFGLSAGSSRSTTIDWVPPEE